MFSSDSGIMETKPNKDHKMREVDDSDQEQAEDEDDLYGEEEESADQIHFSPQQYRAAS